MLKWLTNTFGKARLMRWLMLMENLGHRYIVWDKAADIDFIAPGKGPVFARFWVARVGKTLYVRLKPQARQA